jgi:hypothetical protein
MHQPGKGRFWRKLAAVLAAYVIALQAILSGLGVAALAAPSDAATLPICSEHAADPASNASPPPASDPWLCPCAPACMNAGPTVLSDAPAVMAFTPAAALPAALAKWHDAAIPTIGVRGPQIPRAPPTI